MKKLIQKLVFIVLLFFVMHNLHAQENKYTLSGRVNVDKPSGRIYVILCDEETFETKAGIDSVSFWVHYDRTQIEYEFTNIPEGEYAIKSYQDVNGNHELDKWLFGPREPWGYSYTEKMKFPPEFHDVSFMLMYDTRINITLGN